jgi:hypothetical protein
MPSAEDGCQRLMLTSATGTGWERTPWRAVQSAALEARKKVEYAGGGYDFSARRSSFQSV